MTTRIKLTIGIGVLFMAILLLCSVSLVTVFQLKKDTNNILKANYNSLNYCKNILKILDTPSVNNRKLFEKNLLLQEANITEHGEAELTQFVRSQYELWSTGEGTAQQKQQMKAAILEIMSLNMAAIHHKSMQANITAENSVWLIGTGVVISTVTALLLLIGLPKNTSKPIQQLSQSLRQIAKNNYAERLPVQGTKEFQVLAQSFNEMAEKLHQYNESVLADVLVQKRRLETLINSMESPVIGLNHNLEITFVNDAAAQFIKADSAELIGYPITKVAINNSIVQDWLHDVLIPNAVLNVTMPWQYQQGATTLYFEKKLVPIYLPGTSKVPQQLTGYLLLLNNVTLYRALDTEKTLFIATVSHELKTPISSIQLALQLLQNEQIGSLNAEQQNLLDSIQDDAVRLLQTTSNLLTITQLESGNYVVNIGAVTIQYLLERAISSLQTQADYKHISILRPTVWPTLEVMADTEKTIWVFTNILSNAIKYSNAYTTITISIQEQQNIMSIRFTDQGWGIPEEYLQSIFKKYFRMPNLQAEGTGLGLAICQTIMRQQKGDITVASTVGQGSTFTVHLPVAVT